MVHRKDLSASLIVRVEKVLCEALAKGAINPFLGSGAALLRRAGLSKESGIPNAMHSHPTCYAYSRGPLRAPNTCPRRTITPHGPGHKVYLDGSGDQKDASYN